MCVKFVNTIHICSICDILGSNPISESYNVQTFALEIKSGNLLAKTCPITQTLSALDLDWRAPEACLRAGLAGYPERRNF